jgi:hypothetical protein
VWGSSSPSPRSCLLAQTAIGLPREVLKEGLREGFAYSFQITEAFVNQYEANFYVLAQQMAAASRRSSTW